MTQGLITVMINGSVAMKIVAGCNRNKATEVAKRIRALKKLPTAEEAYQIAEDESFGSEDCLVVMDDSKEVHKTDEELDSRYRRTFHQPKFNPRWDCGSVERFIQIKLK